MPNSTHKPETPVCTPGRCGLGTEARALEVRPQREAWGWLHEDSLKRTSAPQLPGRESRKKSGLVGEARDHCFEVHEEKVLPGLCAQRQQNTT